MSGAGFELRIVRVEDCHPAPYIPERRIIPPEELESLRERIEATGGVEEPILVNKCRCGRGGYDIINGVQRWKIAKELGIEEIPAKVYDISEVEALGLAMLTADRIPESDVDRAVRIRKYVEMREREGAKRSEAVKEVAKIYGKSEEWVRKHLRVAESEYFDLALRALEKSLQEHTLACVGESPVLSIGTLDELFKIGDSSKIEELIERALAEGWSRERLREEIRRAKGVPVEEVRAEETKVEGVAPEVGLPESAPEAPEGVEKAPEIPKVEGAEVKPEIPEAEVRPEAPEEKAPEVPKVEEAIPGAEVKPEAPGAEEAKPGAGEARARVETIELTMGFDLWDLVEYVSAAVSRRRMVLSVRVQPDKVVIELDPSYYERVFKYSANFRRTPAGVRVTVPNEEDVRLWLVWLEREVKNPDGREFEYSPERLRERARADEGLAYEVRRVEEARRVRERRWLLDKEALLSEATRLKIERLRPGAERAVLAFLRRRAMETPWRMEPYVGEWEVLRLLREELGYSKEDAEEELLYLRDTFLEEGYIVRVEEG